MSVPDIDAIKRYETFLEEWRHLDKAETYVKLTVLDDLTGDLSSLFLRGRLPTGEWPQDDGDMVRDWQDHLRALLNVPDRNEVVELGPGEK